jgi:phosphatidylglycerophosphatase A
MKHPVDKRQANGILDYLALAFTTFGVGYIPGAPGTYGSMIAVVIYLVLGGIEFSIARDLINNRFGIDQIAAGTWVLNSILLTIFCLIGIAASTRSIPLLGDQDPSQAVVDELMGQFITLAFIPFGLGWPFILAGFLLFRLFDIWKPYPIDNLQVLPGGLGVCADDIVAGVYAGICLAALYAFTLII